MDSKKCPCCGANMKSYRHSLNKGLAKGLILLDQNGGSAMASKLALTKAQYNNFQKLKYWGLIEKGPMEGESAYVWKITDKGRQFARRKITIPKRVITFRNEPTDFEGENVSIEDALGEFAYWWKTQYLQNAV